MHKWTYVKIGVLCRINIHKRRWKSECYVSDKHGSEMDCDMSGLLCGENIHKLEVGTAMDWGEKDWKGNTKCNSLFVSQRGGIRTECYVDENIHKQRRDLEYYVGEKHTQTEVGIEVSCIGNIHKRMRDWVASKTEWSFMWRKHKILVFLCHNEEWLERKRKFPI